MSHFNATAGQLNLDNASIVSSTSKNNFLGDGFNINRVETVSIRGFIDKRAANTDSKGVREVFGEITTMLANNEPYWASNLSINGHNYGKGRVLSLDFSSDPSIRSNAVHLGEYSAVIELYHEGDLDSWLGNVGGRFGHHYPTKAQMQAAHSEYMRGFDFNSTFGQNENGESTVTENVSISYIAGGTGTFGGAGIGDNYGPAMGYDGTTYSARTLAEALLRHSSGHLYHDDSVLDHRFAGIDTTHTQDGGANPAAYGTCVTGEWSEEYDQINLEYSFSRTMVFYPNMACPYGAKHSRTLNYDENGNIEVTERGNILGHNDPQATHSSGAAWAVNYGIQEEIKNSYGNCTAMFNQFTGLARDDAHYSPWGTHGSTLAMGPQHFPLNSIPIEIGKSIDSGAGVGDYVVKYTNNQRLSGLFINDWTQTATWDQENKITIREDGSLREYTSTLNEFETTPGINRAGFTAGKRSNFNIGGLSQHWGTLSDSAAARATGFYYKFLERVGGCRETIELIQENQEYFFFGPEWSYSKTWSDDPSILTDADAAAIGWKQVKIVHENKLPLPNSKEYLIPNQGRDGELVQVMDQMSLGTLTINVQASRWVGDGGLTPVNLFVSNFSQAERAVIRNLIKDYAIPELLKFPGQTKIKVKEMWISDVNYSFNSDYDCSLVVTADYTSENWIP